MEKKPGDTEGYFWAVLSDKTFLLIFQLDMSGWNKRWDKDPTTALWKFLNKKGFFTREATAYILNLSKLDYKGYKVVDD